MRIRKRPELALESFGPLGTGDDALTLQAAIDATKGTNAAIMFPPEGVAIRSSVNGGHPRATLVVAKNGITVSRQSAGLSLANLEMFSLGAWRVEQSVHLRLARWFVRLARRVHRKVWQWEWAMRWRLR